MFYILIIAFTHGGCNQKILRTRPLPLTLCTPTSTSVSNCLDVHVKGGLELDSIQYDTVCTFPVANPGSKPGAHFCIESPTDFCHVQTGFYFKNTSNPLCNSCLSLPAHFCSVQPDAEPIKKYAWCDFRLLLGCFSVVCLLSTLKTQCFWLHKQNLHSSFFFVTRFAFLWFHPCPQKFKYSWKITVWIWWNKSSSHCTSTEDEEDLVSMYALLNTLVCLKSFEYLIIKSRNSPCSPCQQSSFRCSAALWVHSPQSRTLACFSATTALLSALQLLLSEPLSDRLALLISDDMMTLFLCRHRPLPIRNPQHELLLTAV